MGDAVFDYNRRAAACARHKLSTAVNFVQLTKAPEEMAALEALDADEVAECNDDEANM